MKQETRWLRETYVELLLEYARKDPRIVLVEADLAKAAGTNRFQQEMPERLVNVGIAEASMIGTAAGMAAMGKIPLYPHLYRLFHPAGVRSGDVVGGIRRTEGGHHGQ